MQILCSVKNGYGLSAVQCGIPLKIFVTNDGTSHFRTFIDCEYKGFDDKKNSLEGCLSLKNTDGSIKRFMVPRYENIHVTGYEIFINSVDKKFEKIDGEFSGISSIIMQHEIDHYNGVLIRDIGQEVEVF
jgi:peptide deformylase